MSSRPIYLKVIKGGFIPADKQSAELLREKGFKMGDVVKADIKKIRNPAFNRLVHNIGKLCAENVGEFAGKSAHEVIKKIQTDADIYCETSVVDIPGFGRVECRKPASISFDTMSEDEFHDLALRMCRHVAENYWPSESPESVKKMAENFINE